MNGSQSNSGIALIFFGVLILTISSGIWSVNAQYETPNDQCGGWFRYIHGTIDFYDYGAGSSSDPQKMCIWTVSPTRQYKNFLIRQFRMPNLPCEDFSITINTFKEWDENVHYSKQFCGDEITPPQVIEGTVMVIILRAKQVVISPARQFFIEYDRISADDAIDKGRLIETHYTWGRPTVDPLPYMGAYFLSNALSTFGFLKANYSNGEDYEFRFRFTDIKIDPQTNCEARDFLLVNEIQSDGTLTKLNVYTENATDTPIIRNGYGYFIVYWGGICPVGGGGGGSMMYHYETIRIA